MMALAALLIGLLIAAQGVLGLAAPDVFVRAISFLQTPPVLYLAAVIRVVFGVVLVRAAPASRAPTGLRILGIVIVIGGALTPFVGVWIAHVILGWWSSGGAPVVRVWAAVALALGIFIIYAVAPDRARRLPGPLTRDRTD